MLHLKPIETWSSKTPNIVAEAARAAAGNYYLDSLGENCLRRRVLARPERFELPAYCSGGNRSIQLSYGRASQNYTRE